MNYKESKTAGEVTKWRRSQRVTIENPYGQVPSLTFYEEEKIMLPDGSVVDGQIADPFNVSGQFLDPSTTITLVHPVTDAVIGTATYMDLYVIVYSLYRQLANERDAALTPDPYNVP